jgi:hypothetical protein
MLTFRGWITESKKNKKLKSNTPPTSVSSPIRGANQDQSGFGVKHNTADYTISDENKIKNK